MNIWDGNDARDFLALEEVRQGVFQSNLFQINFSGTIYGGQLVGQSLAAATRTVPAAHSAHSLHAYFLATGSPNYALDYHVECLKEGRSSSLRRVSCRQGNTVIFEAICSFARGHEIYAHAQPRPEGIAHPDSLMDITAYVHEKRDLLPPFSQVIYGAARPIERRLTDPDALFLAPGKTAERHAWVRLPAARTLDAPEMQRCLVAYISDASLLSVSMIPHVPVGAAADLKLASIDHAIWFHADTRVDQWHLYTMESPWAGRGRGLARGLMYDAAGKLIASVAQEGVVLKRS